MSKPWSGGGYGGSLFRRSVTPPGLEKSVNPNNREEQLLGLLSVPLQPMISTGHVAAANLNENKPTSGKYTFIWEHPGADEVFATGTFDNWTKSVKLVNEDGIFKMTVELPRTYTQYKFVVNGDWVTNPTAHTGRDGSGNVNNFLFPMDITDLSELHPLERVKQNLTEGLKEHNRLRDLPFSEDQKYSMPAMSTPRPSNSQSRSQEKSKRSNERNTGDEETIEARVARIKARVAELTRATATPPSRAGTGVTQEYPTPASSFNAILPSRSSLAQGNSDYERSDTSEIVSLQVHRATSRHAEPPKPYITPSSASPSVIEDPQLNLIVSPSQRIDRILSNLDDETARKAFSSYGVSDLWLPIPKQTLRRCFADSRGEKAFLQAQDDVLDVEIEILSSDLPMSTHIMGHAALEDDEDLVTEHRILGEGAFGVVEEVSVPTRLGTTRCVRKKIGRPKHLKAQKQIMTAFARELHVMRQVDHKHCVRFLGSYTDTDYVNILSTPVADMDLAAFLDQPIELKQKRILYRGIGCLCNAINYLHQKNIRHEDLKPQNVLIHGDKVLLTDFGFSLDFSDDSVSTTTGRPSAWTVRYSAPEVLNFEPRNRATDIFSLGCVLTEMVSGFYGINLTDVKAFWKSNGNGQSSFARNPEAASIWLKNMQSFTSMSPKVRTFSSYIATMLEPVRFHRPTSQQIVDCLSDTSILFPDAPQHIVGTCIGGLPCIGLSDSKQTKGVTTFIGHRLKGCHYLAQYLYPWQYVEWAYVLLDLSWDIFYIDIKVPPGLSQQILHDTRIRQAGTNLYKCACRTTSSKIFWQAHKPKSNKRLSSEGHLHARHSARLMSLKHVAFERMSLQSHHWTPSSREEDGHTPTPARRTVQISLLPICLPRSTSYGSFFYMVSFPISESWKDPASTFNDGIVDLTLEA